MSQQDQNKKKYPINHTSAILAMNKALWGEVSPALRAVNIHWDDEVIHLFFYYDGEISEEDHESAECISTELISNFPEYQLEVHILRWDFPKAIPNKGLHIFSRREEV